MSIPLSHTGTLANVVHASGNTAYTNATTLPRYHQQGGPPPPQQNPSLAKPRKIHVVPNPPTARPIKKRGEKRRAPGGTDSPHSHDQLPHVCTANKKARPGTTRWSSTKINAPNPFSSLHPLHSSVATAPPPRYDTCPRERAAALHLPNRTQILTAAIAVAKDFGLVPSPTTNPS